MIFKKENRILFIMLLAWTVINLVQAALTNLFDDEALFWMYGMRPAWGYYEHPPMVGMLIRVGYSVLGNEVGVRILFVLLSTLSFYLISRMTGIKDPWLFGALAFTSVIAQVGGFIAAPDVALMLYVALFFIVYRKLLEKSDYRLSLIWGIIMAAMIYSKYNGILVIIFTLLGNYRLLRKSYFWVAAATGIICMVPHILWSFANGHPTVYYHLFERSFEQFRFGKYFLEFIAGQIGVYGPITGFFLFWAAIAYRPSDDFERSLKFTSLGFLMFFMAYTFRAKVEPNWTLPAFVPILILAHRYFSGKPGVKKWIMTSAVISLAVMLAFRVFLVYDYLHLPRSIVNMSELRGWKEWSEEIGKRANGRPILFYNSYQRASKYIFYTGLPAYTMEDYAGHRTQFWYWSDIEKSLQGKDVMVVDFVPWRWIPGKKAFVTSNGIITYYGYWIDFRSHYKLKLDFKLKQFRFPANASITLPITIYNPYGDTVRFNENKWMRALLVYHLHYQDKFVAEMIPSTDITAMVIPGIKKDTSIRFTTPSRPGNYYFWVSVDEIPLPPPRNMDVKAMEIY